MEEAYDLPEINYNGFYPWAHIRSSVYEMIETGSNDIDIIKEESHDRAGAFRRIFDYLLKSMKIHRKQQLKRAEILFMASSNRVLYNNEYWCPYTDLLADAYGERAFSIDDGMLEVKKSVHTRNLYYLNIQSPLSAITRLIAFTDFNRMLITQKEYAEIEKLAEKIVNAVESSFGHGGLKKSLLNMIIRAYVLWRQKFKQYTAVLKKVSPRVVIWARGMEKARILTEASKALNIPVIELQHGAIGRHDIRYMYRGAYRLPYYPDYLCLWGDYWKAATDFPLKEEHLISCGYPFFDKERSVFPRIEHDEVTIIVISQPKMAGAIGKVTEDLV